MTRSGGHLSRRSLLVGSGLGGAGGFGLASALRGQDALTPASAPIGLNVRDFGARGEGRSDDGPPIQEALDASVEAGGPVTVPAGIYLVRGTLILPSGATLRGAGKEATVIRSARGAELGAIVGHRTKSGANPPASDVFVEDLSLEGGPGVKSGIRLEALSRSSFARVRVAGLHRSDAVGLDITGWRDRTVYRNAADNNFYSVEIADCAIGARLSKVPGDPATFGPGFQNFYGLRIYGHTRIGFDLDGGEGLTAVAMRCTSDAPGVTHIRLNDDVPTLLAPCTDGAAATGQTGIEITEGCTSALILNPLGDMGQAPSNTRIADRGRGTIVLREGLSR